MAAATPLTRQAHFQDWVRGWYPSPWLLRRPPRPSRVRGKPTALFTIVLTARWPLESPHTMAGFLAGHSQRLREEGPTGASRTPCEAANHHPACGASLSIRRRPSDFPSAPVRIIAGTDIFTTFYSVMESRTRRKSRVMGQTLGRLMGCPRSPKSAGIGGATSKECPHTRIATADMATVPTSRSIPFPLL